MTTPAPDYSAIADRLWDRVDDADAFAAAAAIHDLEAKRKRLTDKVEGLDTDLSLAVQVAWRRGAKDWARLNYAALVPWLEACDKAEQARALTTTGGDRHE